MESEVQRVMVDHAQRITALESASARMNARIDDRLDRMEGLMRGLQSDKDSRDGQAFERKRIAASVALLLGATAGATELLLHIFSWFRR